MKRVTPPISLAGSQLNQARHVCAFFTNEVEEYSALLPFVKHRFECGDKAVHIANPEQQPQHLERLSDIGIDTELAPRRGQFEIRTGTEAYLQEGHFEKEPYPRHFCPDCE